MKLAKLVTIAVALVWVGAVQAATTTPAVYTTGNVVPGNNTEYDIAVAGFNTSLGTLTKVTITASLQSWGGEFTVENVSGGSVTVNSIQQGVSGYLYSEVVNLPAGLGPTHVLNAVQTGGHIDLPAYGNTTQLEGPDQKDDALTATSGALSKTTGLSDYQSPYTVSFFLNQVTSVDATGGVHGEFDPAAAEGKVTVEYEYTPIPEPATVGLLALGGLVLGLRRRFSKKA